MKDFRPNPNQPCFCQSSKLFSECCGSTRANRPPPFGVHIVENYLLPSTCAELVTFCESCQRQRLKVIDSKRSRNGLIKQKFDQQRVTEEVDVKHRRNDINQLMIKAYQGIIEPRLNSLMQWLEEPQVLRYQPGGYYYSHSDSGTLDKSTKLWKKVLDRDISALIYLNEDFEGGNLLFNAFNFEVRPRTGMLVFFPSDPRYMHEAKALTAGKRYAIVSWAAAQDVKRVQVAPPPRAIQLR